MFKDGGQYSDESRFKNCQLVTVCVERKCISCKAEPYPKLIVETFGRRSKRDAPKSSMCGEANSYTASRSAFYRRVNTGQSQTRIYSRRSRSNGVKQSQLSSSTVSTAQPTLPENQWIPIISFHFHLLYMKPTEYIITTLKIKTSYQLSAHWQLQGR